MTKNVTPITSTLERIIMRQAIDATELDLKTSYANLRTYCDDPDQHRLCAYRLAGMRRSLDTLEATLRTCMHDERMRGLSDDCPTLSNVKP